MNWWQVCCIIISVGFSGLSMVGGIIYIVNYTSDPDMINSRTNKLKLKLQMLEIQREINADKYNHDQKMIGA